MVTSAAVKKPGEPSRSRPEINFIRLLAKTEVMALEVKSNGSNNWRLEKFIEALQKMLKELRGGPNEPSKETLNEYTKRVELLNGVLATTKLDTVEEKVAATSHLIQLNMSNCVSLDSSRPMEIKHRHRNKYAEDLRNELFGNSSSVDETDAPAEDKDLEQVLRYQQRIQEKIADHMIDLTRSLKEQAALAGEIVRKDTEVLTKSVTQVDANQDKLGTEIDKLAVYNRRACKCWVWIMLALVCCTFVGMVLFMRLFRKRMLPIENAAGTTAPPLGHDET